MPTVQDPNRPPPNVVTPPNVGNKDNVGGTTPHDGAWHQDPFGTWTWSSHTTPDPGPVSQWGYETLTDPRRSPTGERNYGTWVPQHGGGWKWEWARTPDPKLGNSLGYDKLTDPDHIPTVNDTLTEGELKGDSATDHNRPPPPDVVPPTLTDGWGNHAPDLTGNIPPQEKPKPGGQQSDLGPARTRRTSCRRATSATRRSSCSTH